MDGNLPRIMWYILKSGVFDVAVPHSKAPIAIDETALPRVSLVQATGLPFQSLYSERKTTKGNRAALLTSLAWMVNFR